MGVKPGEAKGDVEESLLDCLHPQDARNLRAKAWRHVRRIDPVIARKVWRHAVSLKRYATRRDSSQRAIIEALELAGAEVWVIEKPCDLLTLFRGRWMPLECKPVGWKPRKDQQHQAEELQRARIPVAMTPVDALKAIGAI